ncbi:GTPase IMAP family member 7-like isoform X2 [Girardinichthys multiradiatus]|uniref:GTPase IMAP family member 7-like isoform X2 n=1 Tax=Girardinichthys multiradiatus TaxID=208333 RepID=UPI001FAC67AF|nr:GTPase IMAP family member 7-like isoform X2 [Girardinichthys multiradiatus]
MPVRIQETNRPILAGSSVLSFSLIMNESIRMVLLGKTGAGKSSLGNTICGDQLFTVSHSVNSETSKCKAITRSVSGRNLMVIDTPGFFDTDQSEEDLKPEIIRCITECAPGPHVFLIVLKVEKFTEHEQAVIKKIYTYFSEDVFKYAVVVFTHGDQLPDGMQIEEFAGQNKLVSELVKKCGDRCHVFDHKYWNNDQKEEYRNNQFQMERLLQTIDIMVRANKGSCYTNDFLKAVKKEIQEEEENIRLLPGSLSEAEIRERAKTSVLEKLLIRLSAIAVGFLLGAVFGVVVFVGGALTILKGAPKPVPLKEAMGETVAAAAGTVLGTGVAAVAGGSAAAVVGLPGTVVSGFAATGAVKGALIGYDVAEGAQTPEEAAQKTAEAVKNEAQVYLDKAHQFWNKVVQPNSQASEEEEEKSLLGDTLN